jgi:uncharacterized protein (TIGR02452 family)
MSRNWAKETLDIIERGGYAAPSGTQVSLRAQVDAAIAGTVLYRPDDFAALASQSGDASTTIEVTGETTAEAGRRLAARFPRVVGLNFASAKNVGGGFLGGAKAQEEDLCRCSALYACLITKPDYYSANRAFSSLMYTDHMIYSPDVPFFRDERLSLMEAPFLLSIITAPAPNAGEVLNRTPNAHGEIRRVLEARAKKVLAIAAAHQHRTLVLGAWGCGVFRNNPDHVAHAFTLALADFKGAFGHITFAVYDRAGHNRAAFENAFR